jgi:hypothetical protein
MRANIFYDAGNISYYLDPANISILNDVRASIFYDRDNTGYYLDPASSSNLNILNTIGTTRIGTLSGTGTRIVLADATGILSANTAAGAGLVSGTGTTNYVTKWTGTNTQGNSQIFDNGTNVGIGTNSPSAGLHMYQNRYTLYGPNSSWGAYLQVGGNGRVTTYASVAATNGNLHIDAADGAGYATFINYYSQNNTYLNALGGNVGIGTGAPVQKLHVVGQIAINDNNTRIFEGAGDALRVQTSTGYTDIGPQNAAWSHFSTDRPRFYFNTGLTVDSGNIGTYDENLSLQTAGTTRVTVLNSNGYVGIGTTIPSYSLHVPSGYIGTDYINTTDNVVGSGVTGIMVKAGDNFHRTASAAAVCAFLNNGTFIPNNGIGDWQIASSSTGTAYNVASLELRESNFTGTGAATPPRLGFHWGGVVASQIGIESTGRIAILNNPGTAYENLIANNIYSAADLNSAANLVFTSANPTISASSYFIAPGGAYFNSGTVYFQSQIQARGGIHDDTNANLTIAGGTSGATYFSGPISGMSGSYPANNMIRLTPNLHLNSLAGNAVILNWDNGTTGNTQTLRIGNGAGTDVFNVWASGNTSIGTTPSTLYKLYTLATQLTASGDGQASIYGYRTRDSQNDGTGYYAYSSNNAITGYNYWGDLYTFGVFGHSDGDYTRTGGTIGETGGTWGSLGYKGSNSVNYGVYGSNAYSSGGGFLENSTLSGVGIAGFGQLMGGWSRGELMGFTTSGEMYALYNDGNSYTEGYSADIVKTEEGRKAAYSVTSTELKVYDDGSYEINGNEIFVSFDKDFASMINPAQNPTITVSPVGGWAPLYIKEIRQDGFVVANDNYNGNNVKFSWIAVAERIDSENAELPKDIADDKFNENLKGFMFNENITNRNATPMWWDGSTLRFDAIPEKPIDEAAKKAEEERMKQ